MNIEIITDSACDLTQEEAQAMGVRVLPLKISFGSEEYLDGINLSRTAFYEHLVETDELPHTSLLSPYDYTSAFDEAVKGDKAVICITLSSGLSGCWQSATIAAGDYEDQVHVVDSRSVCVGQRLLVERAVQLREEGRSVDEIVHILEANRDRIHVIALLDTLEYLKKGGRISAAAAAAGALLSIKPVVTVQDGKVAVLGKARGSRNANNLLTEFIQREGAIDFTMPLAVAYSGLSDSLLQKYMQDHTYLYDSYEGDIPVSIIGSAIGTHVGPGAIAFAFMTKSV